MSSVTASPSLGSQPQTPIVVRKKNASPWRVTRFSPLSPYLPKTPAPNPLIPDLSTLLVTGPILNPLYLVQTSAVQKSPQQVPEKVIHLTLPFSLCSNGIPRDPTEDELPALKELFPTLTTVRVQHPFLVLVVKVPPPKPWPVVLAGLPLWLTTNAFNDPPLDLGKFARAAQKSSINGTIHAYETPSETTVLEIFGLVNSMGAGVDRIRWDGLVFRAFGPQDPVQGWQNRLPSSVNGFPISYNWTPSDKVEKALRMKMPNAEEQDDSRYPTNQLRPGIMVGGIANNMINILSTTSGVCVQSPTSSNKFITVAAHGFDGCIGDSVYHPKPVATNNVLDDRYKIATIERLFGDTDIALARLEPGIGYSGETFCEPDQPHGQAFRSLKDPSAGGMRLYDPVFMNTPFNGQCEGVHLATEWTVVYAEGDEKSQEPPTHSEIMHFSYWGNGSDVFLDGSCGGVIWDQNFDVLGQFRYQNEEGDKLAIAPTFKVLIEQGYQLSTI